MLLEVALLPLPTLSQLFASNHANVTLHDLSFPCQLFRTSREEVTNNEADEKEAHFLTSRSPQLHSRQA